MVLSSQSSITRILSPTFNKQTERDQAARNYVHSNNRWEVQLYQAARNYVHSNNRWEVQLYQSKLKLSSNNTNTKTRIYLWTWCLTFERCLLRWCLVVPDILEHCSVVGSFLDCRRCEVSGCQPSSSPNFGHHCRAKRRSHGTVAEQLS